jgi:hypothetical protein
MEKMFAFCVTLCLSVLMGSITFYKYNEMKSIEKNIDAAIAKGIDPLAVKCAYSDGTTNLCLTYTMQQSLPSKK